MNVSNKIDSPLGLASMVFHSAWLSWVRGLSGARRGMYSVGTLGLLVFVWVLLVPMCLCQYVCVVYGARASVRWYVSAMPYVS